MVVVSGSWGKNATAYPIAASDDMVISATAATTTKMSAMAVLTARPNSHPFQERSVVLDHRVKVGRSVARARALPTNAIFDCKVLSRHHAVLWYDAGKFYLQDTKSSNGTFVNNNKLSSSGTEAQEVCSGDIVQFGVNVLENNRKVTHNCIVATLKLYLPDGKEAKASPSVTETPHNGAVSLEELYKLNQIIQEAMQREQCLETKLTVLQRLVEETRKSTEQSWQVYIGEERLLSRIATLQGQLAKAARNLTDETLREELTKLQDEKVEYQVAAKEALSKLHEKRLEAVCFATEREKAHICAEQETVLLKEQLAQALQEIHELAQTLTTERIKGEEDKAAQNQSQRELQARLDAEVDTANELRAKLRQLKLFEQLEKLSLISKSDLKAKEELLDEIDTCENESLHNESNSPSRQNHIHLTVAPVENSDQVSAVEQQQQQQQSSATLVRDDTVVDSDQIEAIYRNTITAIEDWCKVREDEKSEQPTLKYQHQSLGVIKHVLELKRISQSKHERIVSLETEMREQRDAIDDKTNEMDKLRRELHYMEQQLKENCAETQQLREQVAHLTDASNGARDSTDTADTLNISTGSFSAHELEALEEELVTLKERFVSVNDEKMQLNRSLSMAMEQYDALRNRSSNTIFFYVAPLVLMVVYLLISQYFS